MACTPFNLRTNGLTGADTGGTWSVVTGSYGGPALSGDNPAVNITTHIGLGLSVIFRYTIFDPCTASNLTADVQLLRMNLGSASNFSETICTTSSTQNIFSRMSGILGPHGAIAWSGSIANPGFSGSGTSALFNPSLSGVGTFVFTATINPVSPGGYTDLGCCDPIVRTYTVTVANAFSAGTGGTFAGC